MSTLEVELHPQAHRVKCSVETIFVELLDGRTISAPLVWFPKLSQASSERQKSGHPRVLIHFSYISSL